MTLQNQTSPDPDEGPQAGFPAMLATLAKRPPAKDDIIACLAAYDDIAPLLRALVTDAANGAVMSQAHVITLNNGLFILASRRDIQTCRPLLRLLALTKPQTGIILRRTRLALRRIIPSIFDGDHDALFTLVSDRSLNPSYRSAALDAAAYLAWKGAIERDAIHVLLRSLPVNDTVGDENVVVQSWMIAIAVLGMRDLAPLVHHRMTISDFGIHIADRPNFERRLESAEKDPTNAENHEIFDLGEIDDAVFALTRCGPFLDSEQDFAVQRVEGGNRSIQDIVVELLTAPQWGDDIIEACLNRMAQIAPLLRAEVSRAAARERLSRNDSIALCRCLYILGQARDRRTFQPLLRLLQRPPLQLGNILAPLFFDLSRIIISVFDWNAEPLFSLIADRTTDDLIRTNLVKATAFLTFEGRIARDRMTRCLAALDVDNGSDDIDSRLLYDSWYFAIAALGLRELAPLVERTLDATPSADLQKVGKGRQSPLSYFHSLLTKAEQNPHDDELFTRFDEGPIDDLTDILSDHSDPRLCTNPTAEESEPAPQKPARPRGRARNPMRNVGRNDPCPCGSGLKAKKCCLKNKQ